MTLKDLIGPARRLARRLRGVPVLGVGVRAVDTVHWFRVVVSSGLVDTEFYAAQRGRRVRSLWWSAAHYVGVGFKTGHTPNPLFDELYTGAQLPDVDRVPALYAYLVSDRLSVVVHPWWFVGEEGARTPLARVWADDSQLVTVRVGHLQRQFTVRECRRWVIDACSREHLGGDHAPAELIVRRLAARDRDQAQKLADAVDAGSSVLIVCPAEVESGTWASVALATFAAADAIVASRGVDASALQISPHLRAVCVLDAEAQMSREDLRRLLELARDRVVAPLTISDTGTVDSCGTLAVPTGAGPRLFRLLADHPVEDAAVFRGRSLAVTSVGPAVYGFPAALLAPGEAVDLDAATLCSRAEGIGVDVVVCGELSASSGVRAFRSPSPVRVDRARAVDGVGPSRAEELLADAGFGVVRWVEIGHGEIAPVLRRLSRTQRWAIKTSAPAGLAGRAWGDAHFARGLAAALRRRGHEVVVDAHPATARQTTYLDDVHVVIRGPFPIAPPDEGVRVEWIISHPDEVTATEVAAFDLVFAVSPGWAQRVSRQWGVAVLPLLECTDADVFFPRGGARTQDIVFVGTARGIARPVVVTPLAAGIDVKVYGPDWRGFIPAHAIAGTHIPNEGLSTVYERAAVVLNDHWPAMRREGFMAMRPFDVVASGGRVISERVEGMKDIFEGAVVEFDSEEELISLLRRPLDALFPSEEEVLRISRVIRTHHSFDVRAEQLDVAVRKFLGKPPVS